MDFKNVTELWTVKDCGREGEMFHHEQVLKNDYVYVYKVYKPETPRYCWFEVFKRKIIADVIHEGSKIYKSKENGHVAYPGNKDFGRWAKNCPTFNNFLKNDRFDAWYWVIKWTKEGREAQK